ncbi:hypothetical protein ACX40_12420 [Listeria monocytogenes]|uniref:Uncharacterized protein n=1 Tax=Listeria monocytogenes TaxID=1639 RepID=A0A9P1WZ93_LISMN|nr:hypothetical protein [Listeria monocytogenes]EAA0249078.1 hypothetical protein [Listeria monocytogenes]EAA0252140.1 hypothetical protein [Listeria monocytogenes]EAA0264088.1 hypothetical protein [Listeria monocytogenes]EAA0384468.1 hypothetical protein [Listeria monocytogenes]
MNDKPYKYQVVRLKKEFFQSNLHSINMLDPGNPEKQMRRTYLYLDIQKDHYHYLIPFRSHLNHRNGVATPFKDRPKAGLDYSHTLIIKDSTYIQPAFISNDQYREVKNKMKPIYSRTSRYISDFMNAYKKGIVLDLPKYQNSTLINFVGYLEKEWTKQVPLQDRKQTQKVKENNRPKNSVPNMRIPFIADIDMPISINLYRQVFYKIGDKIKEMG